MQGGILHKKQQGKNNVLPQTPHHSEPRMALELNFTFLTFLERNLKN